MKVFKYLSVVLFLMFFKNGFAQDNKIGFYLQSEYGAMFLEDHVGHALGFNIGITSKNKKWDIGLRYYGRSGPINLHQEYELVLPAGTTYKGKSVLLLAADHGYFGLELAYLLSLGNDRVKLRFPVSFGQLGAGFYLQNEDRETPDGRRVNEWEDELQGGQDAGFGLSSEIGVQGIFQLSANNELINLAIGLHYLNTYDYTSFLGGDDFYNNRTYYSPESTAIKNCPHSY